MNPTTKELVRSLILEKNGHAYLRKSKPRDDRARAAWLGCTAAWNPYKAAIGSILFLGPEEREIFHEVEAWASANMHLRGLDSDRLALEQLGVW